jgi:hypothetical protein
MKKKANFQNKSNNGIIDCPSNGQEIKFFQGKNPERRILWPGEKMRWT